MRITTYQCDDCGKPIKDTWHSSRGSDLCTQCFFKRMEARLKQKTGIKSKDHWGILTAIYHNERCLNNKLETNWDFDEAYMELLSESWLHFPHDYFAWRDTTLGLMEFLLRHRVNAVIAAPINFLMNQPTFRMTEIKPRSEI